MRMWQGTKAPQARSVAEALPTDITAGGQEAARTQTDPNLPTNHQHPASMLAPESAPEHHKHNPETPFTPPGTETTEEVLAKANQQTSSEPTGEQGTQGATTDDPGQSSPTEDHTD